MLNDDTLRTPNAWAPGPLRRSTIHVTTCPPQTTTNAKTDSHSRDGVISKESKLTISAQGNVMRRAMVDRTRKSSPRSHPRRLTR